MTTNTHQGAKKRSVEIAFFCQEMIKLNSAGLKKRRLIQSLIDSIIAISFQWFENFSDGSYPLGSQNTWDRAGKWDKSHAIVQSILPAKKGPDNSLT